MATPDDDMPVFGIVNQLIYGLDKSDLASPTAMEATAAALIEQRIFTLPVETYYVGARKYLDSAHDSRIIRNELPVEGIRRFLTGVLEQLDSRRPWAEPPYRVTADDNLWSAPSIGSVSGTFRQVANQLGGFSRARRDDSGRRLLTLTLRTGAAVGLREVATREKAVELVSHSVDPDLPVVFGQLTGLPVRTRSSD
jgi:hypothetical protein